MKGFNSITRAAALAAALSMPVAGLAADQAVDINTAGVERLVELDGIGPAYAQRIVDYREQHGPFDTVDQLGEVNGIGPKTLEEIRKQVVIRK
jgi:competence protein ComEA